MGCAHERDRAMRLRRDAGDWALDISAAEFARLFAVCHHCAVAAALLGLYSDRNSQLCVGAVPWVWRSISTSFSIGEEGYQWIVSQAPMLIEDTWKLFGHPQPPSDKDVDRLLPR